MGKTVQLVAVIPKEIFDKFVQNKRVDSLDTMPQLSANVKAVIREFMSDNVGYDKDPIACLSKYNGVPTDIQTVGYHVSEILPTKTGSTLWQMQMPEDMVISVGVEDLLSYSHMMRDVEDDFELEILGEDFKNLLSIGYSESPDVVSFLPFIDLNKCKQFAAIDESWDLSRIEVPGVEKVKLVNMNVF